MSGVTEKIKDFSIWASVVKDRMIQFEDLDQRCRDRGKKIETLTEENELLKERMAEASVKLASINNELNKKETQIQTLSQEIANLKQWIVNMENSTCWKLTKPIRLLADIVRDKR